VQKGKMLEIKERPMLGGIFNLGHGRLRLVGHLLFHGIQDEKAHALSPN